jgi:hypothetical protein
LLESQAYHALSPPSDGASLASSANLDALRIANVRYVLSELPLADPELRSLSDRCPNARFTTIGESGERWLARWSPNPRIGSLLLYELPDPWPRMFIASEARISDAEVDDPSFYQELFRGSKRPIALVSRRDAQPLGDLGPIDNGYSIVNYSVVPNGFTVELASTSTAGRGILVANVPYSASWRASVNGRSLVVFPVNGVQTAVLLDRGGGTVSLRYEVDGLLDRIAGGGKPVGRPAVDAGRDDPGRVS